MLFFFSAAWGQKMYYSSNPYLQLEKAFQMWQQGKYDTGNEMTTVLLQEIQASDSAIESGATWQGEQQRVCILKTHVCRPLETRFPSGATRPCHDHLHEYILSQAASVHARKWGFASHSLEWGRSQ